MKRRIKQWWSGEKVKDQGYYVPYVVIEPPLIRTLYERLPKWVWFVIGTVFAGMLQEAGTELFKLIVRQL